MKSSRSIHLSFITAGDNYSEEKRVDDFRKQEEVF